MRHRWRLYRAAEPPRGWPTAATLILIYAGPAFLLHYICKDAASDAALYLSNGIIVAGLLVLQRRVGLLFCLACFAIDLIQNVIGHTDLAHNICYAVLNQGVSLATAIMIRSLCGAASDLFCFRRLIVFAGITLVAASGEALVGQVTCVLIERSSAQAFLHWLQWVAQDALGLLIGTPAVLLPLKRGRAIYASEIGRTETWLLMALTLALSVAAFMGPHTPIILLIYPMLVLVAFRAGPVWVAMVVLALAANAAGMTLHGLGPIAWIARGDPLHIQMLLQLFILSIFATAVPATTALAQRNQARQRLQRAHATARRARASAEAANLAKSQFLANVSHEIRTPLNGVLGMTQAMAADPLPPFQRERLDLIRNSGQALLTLLNDVLDLSKIEAGKLQLECVPFDLDEVARGACATFESVARQKAVGLTLTISKAAGGGYLGDPARVRQVLNNLISNALKFTETGEVSVEVGSGDKGLLIDVRDTGVGISPEQLTRLFQKFEQADVSTTRRFGGTGLGLAICRELVERMGGVVDVQSRLGEGSIFSVTLPLMRCDPACQRAEPSDAPYKDAFPSTARILAVDDNPVNLVVLRTLLQQVGLSVETAANGAQAVDAWRLQRWDLILMDVQMPVMDGLAATRMIRKEEAASGRPRTPIVALTADVMAHQIAASRAAGVDDVVGKPIDARALFEVVAATLDGAEGAPMPAESEALYAATA